MSNHSPFKFTDPALADSQVWHHEKSRWQDIKLARHPLFGEQLILDDDLQYSTADSIYDEILVAPVLPLDRLTRVGILGGGDGGVLATLVGHTRRLGRPLSEAVMIDIDEVVTGLCRKAFPHHWNRIDNAPEASVINGDAFAWLDSARDLDALIYDLTMNPVRESQTREAFVQETLQRIANALRPGGVLTMQCCGQGYSSDDLARHDAWLSFIGKALEQDFTAIQTHTALVPSFLEPWTFLRAQRKG